MSKDTPKERAEEYFKEKKGITPDQAFNSKAKYSSIDMVCFAESFAKQEVERACKHQRYLCADEIKYDPEVESSIIDDFKDSVLNAPSPLTTEQ